MQSQSSRFKYQAIVLFVLVLAGSALFLKENGETNPSGIVTQEDTADLVEEVLADALPATNDSLKLFQVWVQQPASYKLKLDEGIKLAKRRALQLKRPGSCIAAILKLF